MLLSLFIVPFVSGVLTFVLPGNLWRRSLLVCAAVAHFAGAIYFSFVPSDTAWFALDALGKIFIVITSFLFLAATVYCLGYLKRESGSSREDFEQGFIFRNAPEAVFCGCLLFFLSAMTLVIISRHFGLIWVAMEATTLASAPLIYFHRHRRSLEATWKYLLICSVGIALALLGNMFLAAAAAKSGHGYVPLFLNELIKHAVWLDPVWLKAAFLLMVVGYGTKMGLAPLHAWLPDAHSEAPSVVSALLSGALLNCAFLAILRAHQVCLAAGLNDFSRDVLTVLGLASLVFAAVFITGQPDYKRMLAYSSVEHMGILALGVGLGKAAVYAVMFQAINHSLGKALLFFTAGNILAVYQTKQISQVRGILRVLPVSGFLWLAGFLVLAGMPPSGLFLSEFLILKSAMDARHFISAIIYLAALTVVFISMSRIVFAMSFGLAPDSTKSVNKKEDWRVVAPQLIFLGLVILLGLYMPRFLHDVLTQAALAVEGF